MAANPDRRGLSLMLLLAASTLSAQAPESARDNSAAPSAELLLYMAEFTDDQGRWVDPEALEQMSEADAASHEPHDRTTPSGDPRDED